MKRGLQCSLALVALSLLFLTSQRAQLKTASAAPLEPEPNALAPDNEACLACHAAPDLKTEFPSGETLSLTVSPEAFAASVHGQAEMACVQCHTDITGFPHPPLEAATRRLFALQLYQTCAQCHEDKYSETLDSVHQEALAAGNFNAAVCTDCHGAHDVKPAGEARNLIPQTCRQCHTQIFDLYSDSVHGSDLLEAGNPDVPTCTDCHGVHRVEGPSAGEAFHLFSPLICAECHADEALMASYGISTEVFDTYVADFHGTTVTLFQSVAPGQETNKPVCIDCHGIHDIVPVDAQGAEEIRENILRVCQRCHPSATTNFSAAWLSHYRPSRQHAPLVYYVQLFYRILIPAVIGGMALLVVGDASRRFLSRREGSQDE